MSKNSNVTVLLWVVLTLGLAGEVGCVYFYENGTIMRFEFNADRRIETLLDKYFPAMHKPFVLDNTIYMFAELYSVLDVNEIEETITTKLWFYQSYMIWNMDQATWDYSLGHYVFYFTPPAARVWKPDIIIINSVETVEAGWERPVIIKSCCYYSRGKCIVFCPLVTFSYPLTVKTHCEFDVTDFPFDKQRCDIDIGPWYTSLTEYPREHFYDMGAYHIKNPMGADEMSLKSFVPSSQWDVKSVKIKETTRTLYMGHQVDSIVVRYTIEMERRPEFFLYTLVLPCVLLAMLDALSVILPVESGEKIGLGITIMLAQVVNLLILSTILPSSSQFFPHLGMYFLATVGIIEVTVLYNCLITGYFHNDYRSMYEWTLRRIGLRPKTASRAESSNIQSATSEKGNSVEMTSVDLTVSVGKMEQIATETEDDTTFHSDERVRQRRDTCAFCDTVFGIFISFVILVVHLYYFGGHMFG